MLEIIQLGAVVYGLIAIVVNLLFAAGVLKDASRLETQRRLLFVEPWVWCLATFGGGVLVASAYWVLHHSSLRQPPGAADAGDIVP